MGKISNPYYDPTKPHHTERGFRNLSPFTLDANAVRRWRKARKANHLPKPPNAGYAAFVDLWWQPADFSAGDQHVWWLGHASTYLRLNGCAILTDPLFYSRAFSVSFAGPERRTPAPTRVADLPQLDVVLISHNHYDHLDYLTINALIKRFPDACFLVPLGLKAKLHRWGVKQVIERDWWQSYQLDALTFSCLPAQHWSQRTLFDRNRSLWCGWAVECSDFRYYFMGDSGYSEPLFDAIAARFDRFDMAAIPIGAYAPRWFMQNQHIDPAQAVRVFQQLNCQQGLAIHWGVFELADESLDEPPSALDAAKQAHARPTMPFHCIKIGAHLPLSITPPGDRPR